MKSILIIYFATILVAHPSSFYGSVAPTPTAKIANKGATDATYWLLFMDRVIPTLGTIATSGINPNLPGLKNPQATRAMSGDKVLHFDPG